MMTFHSNDILCDLCNDKCDYIEITIYMPDDADFIDRDLSITVAHCYNCNYNFIAKHKFVDKIKILEDDRNGKDEQRRSN